MASSPSEIGDQETPKAQEVLLRFLLDGFDEKLRSVSTSFEEANTSGVQAKANDGVGKSAALDTRAHGANSEENPNATLEFFH